MSDSVKVRRRERLDSLEGWRKDTEQDSKSSQDQFDKAIMTLSAGGIGLTFAFLDKIVPFADASLKWLLFAIWFLWGLSLLSTVCSFFTSTQGLMRAVGQISDEIEDVRNAQDSDDVPAPINDGGKWNRATKILNCAAGALFILGLVAMLFFIWYNLFMTAPKPPQHTSDGGQVAATRPPQATPATRGQTVTSRPPASSPKTGK